MEGASEKVLDHLSHSPLEILIDIVSHLDVVSIIRLAMVSKYFFVVLGESRIVWLRSVTTTLQQELIPPSFLMESPVTMSTPDLVLFATRPYRLGSMIRGGSIIRTPPSIVKLYLGGEPHHPLYPFMCPGGRWLLDVTKRGNQYDSVCWDLSKISGEEEEALMPSLVFPFSQESSPVGFIQNISHQINNEGTEVRMLWSYPYNHNAPAQLSVFEVVTFSSPKSESDAPAFSSAAHIITRTGMATFLEGDHVCILYRDDSCLVWNWRLQTWATIECNGILTSINLLSAYENELLFISSNFYFIQRFTIPQLTPTSQEPILHAPEPETHPIRPFDISGRASYWGRPNHWKPHESRMGTLVHARIGAEEAVISFDASLTPTVLAKRSNSRFIRIPYYVAPGNLLDLDVTSHSYDGSDVVSMRISPFLQGLQGLVVPTGLELDASWRLSNKPLTPCLFSGTLACVNFDGELSVQRFH